VQRLIALGFGFNTAVFFVLSSLAAMLSSFATMFFVRGGFTTVLSSLAPMLSSFAVMFFVRSGFTTMLSSLAAMLFVRSGFTTVLSRLATVPISNCQERGQCQYQKQFFHVQFLVAVDQSVVELRLFQRQIQVSLPEWFQQKFLN